MTHDWQQTETGATCSRCPAELTAENHDEACSGGVGVVVFESIEEFLAALSSLEDGTVKPGTSAFGALLTNIHVRVCVTIYERDGLRVRVAELENALPHLCPPHSGIEHAAHGCARCAVARADEEIARLRAVITDAAEEVLEVATYINDAIEADSGIAGSATVDPLMGVHGELLDALEAKPQPDAAKEDGHDFTQMQVDRWGEKFEDAAQHGTLERVDCVECSLIGNSACSEHSGAVEIGGEKPHGLPDNVNEDDPREDR